MQLDDNNFENEVSKFNGVALVDFFAPWCGPCKIQGPIIEELASENTNANIKIAKIDVDANPASAEKFGIMSIPTLIIFKNGEVVEVMNGLQNKESLKEKLLKLI